MKQHLLGKAIELRKLGNSMGDISKKLGISKSTASSWVRDIELPFDIKSKLYKRKTATRNKELAANNRKNFQKEGKNLAKLEDIQYAMGCMLYWAEGAKNKNTVCITNTDADLLLFFKNFLDKYFKVQTKEYTIILDCYLNNGLSENEIKIYWINLLGLDFSCFRKCNFKLPDKNKKCFKKNIHKYGICRLTICRTDIVQKIFGSIQQYANIDRPEWLW